MPALFKKKSVIIVAAQLIGWTVYAHILYLIARSFNPSNEIAFERNYFHAAVGCFLSSGLIIIYKNIWPKITTSYLRMLMTIIVASLVAGILWTGVSDFFGNYYLLEDPDPENWFKYSAKGVINAWAMLMAWSAGYAGIRYGRALQTEKENALRAYGLAQQAQLLMLRYQVNPHFLFNALNSIKALIDENHARAREMVTELADFLRYSLANTGTELVAFRDEITAMRHYLLIEKIRFEEKLVIEWNIADEAENINIPGFLIHPLIENAIKYGMQTSSKPLRLRLIASVSNKCFRFELSNSGKLVKSNSSSGNGIGLNNVRLRLQQAFSGRHRFTIDEKNGWVHAVIEIDLE
ncbi:histidine kinase [bacterium]|nr:histidine kinase [bacterium]